MNTLNCHLILAKVDACLLLERVDDVLDEDDVKVLATKMGIAIG